MELNKFPIPKVLLIYINKMLSIPDKLRFAETCKQTRDALNTTKYKLMYEQYKLGIYQFDDLDFVQYLVVYCQFTAFEPAMTITNNPDCFNYLKKQFDKKFAEVNNSGKYMDILEYLLENMIPSEYKN